jgi:predicted SAM-dependent methyltransferase
MADSLGPSLASQDTGAMLRLARALGVSRAALWVVRGEVEAKLASFGAACWPPSRARLRALRRQRGLLVNVGSGPFVLDGFVNLDLRRYHPAVIRWDCRRSLPLSDGSCAGIRIEHFLEHVDPRDELPLLLQACHRALGPGGVLRLIVPDIARFMAAYFADGRTAFDALGVPNPLPDDLPTRLDAVNHMFYQWHEHRWAYDLDNLRWRLQAAGFHEVLRARFGQSRLPALAADRDAHVAYSLYVDAVKSAENTPRVFFDSGGSSKNTRGVFSHGVG